MFRCLEEAGHPTYLSGQLIQEGHSSHSTKFNHIIGDKPRDPEPRSRSVSCCALLGVFALLADFVGGVLLVVRWPQRLGECFFLSWAGAGPEPGRSRARVRAGRKREPGPGRSRARAERSERQSRAGAGLESGSGSRGRAGAGPERSGVSARAGPEPEPGRSRAGAGQSQSGAEAGGGVECQSWAGAGPEPGRSRAGAGPESERGAPAGPEPGQCEMADGRRNLLRCVATYAPKFRAGRSESWSRSRAGAGVRAKAWFRAGRVGAGWSCSLDCAEREPETWSQPARAPELAKLQLLSILCMFQSLSFKKHTHTRTHNVAFMYVCMCMYVCMYVCL